SCIPSLPRKQTPWQPTPGPSGTQWLEDLCCEPSQTDEPPIPGPSPSSEPHEDILTCEPEPEVAPTQSMEEPFGRSQLFFFYSSKIFLTFPSTISSLSHSTHSLITINDTPVGSPLPPLLQWFPPSAPKNPTASSPHSHNDACQEFTDLRTTLMIP
ncbi:hypothetical protein O181_099254, partial [Austropuccinia psidii MF-1]|nr:hypothetical protein [Austropuccinia psidii MF-1]